MRRFNGASGDAPDTYNVDMDGYLINAYCCGSRLNWRNDFGKNLAILAVRKGFLVCSMTVSKTSSVNNILSMRRAHLSETD